MAHHLRAARQVVGWLDVLVQGSSGLLFQGNADGPKDSMIVDFYLKPGLRLPCKKRVQPQAAASQAMHQVSCGKLEG
jgi:hypothetical protein